MQYVNRPNLYFRGTLAAGILHAGQAKRVLPSGKIRNVQCTITFDGDQEGAYPRENA